MEERKSAAAISQAHSYSPLRQPRLTTPALGSDLVILDAEGNHTDNGEVFLIPPSMGLSTELLGSDHHEVYFKELRLFPNTEPLRRHGDQVERLAGDSTGFMVAWMIR